MKAAVCFLALLTAAASADTPPELPPAPDLGKAYVTIPYSELRALWEAGQPKKSTVEPPEPAPVSFLVHRADLRIVLGEAVSKIDADFDVEVLDKKWQRVPLLGGEVRLEKSEAGERSIVWNDGYALMTNVMGKSPVTMHLVTRGSGQLTAPLKLTVGSASVKRLSVAGIPAGMEARVNGHSGATTGGVAVFLLPGDAGEISLELAPPKIEVAAKPLPPITASHWQTQSQVLVRFVEGRLRYTARVYAKADDGSGLETQLILPAKASAIDIAAEDLADWSQTRTEDGRRILHVRWKSRDILDRELAIVYSVPQSPLADQWNLQAPASEDDKETRHLYAILPAEGIELKGEGIRVAAESRQLPEWMRKDIDATRIVTAEAGSQLSLQAHWLPAIKAAEATVSAAKASLRLVTDGATQTTVSYTINHQAPLAWRLELPANVELLSCTVGTASAQLIQRDNGVVELPLPAPSKNGTTVTLVYASKLTALDPVSGDVTLELPRTPLFVTRLDWTIAIPAIFEVTATDGNVRPVENTTTPTKGDRIVALEKELYRAERPSVSVFYQRQTLEK